MEVKTNVEPVQKYCLQLKQPTGTGKFHFKIEDFLKWSEDKEKGFFIRTPSASFVFDNLMPKEYKFSLSLYPKGKISNGDKDTVGLFFYNDNPMSTKMFVAVELVDAKGHALVKGELEKKFNPNASWGWERFQDRKELYEKENQLLPSGALTLKCVFKIFQEREIISCDNAMEKKKTDQLRIDFEKMFLTDLFTDFEVISDGEVFQCHKAILAARSNVFCDMLTKKPEFDSTENQLIIQDFGPRTVSKMLQYLYSGKLSAEELLCADLLKIADKYKIQDLKEDCEIELLKGIKIENVAKILSVAHKIKATILIEQAGIFIAKNYDKVKKTLEWKKLLRENANALDLICLKLAKSSENQNN